MSDDNIFELTPEDLEDSEFPSSRLSRDLDEALEGLKNGDYKAPLFFPVVGLTGSGKTSIIKGWLEHRKLKNWYISGCRPLTKVEVEYYPKLSNEPQVRMVTGGELEKLLTPKTKTVNVLFSSDEIDNVDDQTIVVIDDYDRASDEVRKELYSLIYNRVVDPRVENENKIRLIKPLMYVVVVDYSNIKVLNTKEKILFGLTDEL